MYLRKYPKYRLKTILHHPRRVENGTGNAENMSRRLTFVQPLPRNIFPAIGVTDTETKRQGWIYTYIPPFLINFKRWTHELILVSASCNLVIYIWLKVGKKKRKKKQNSCIRIARKRVSVLLRVPRLLIIPPLRIKESGSWIFKF